MLLPLSLAVRKEKPMVQYGALLAIALAAYFLYSILNSLKAARRRREEAEANFGKYREHPQEDFSSLRERWAAGVRNPSFEVDDITWNDLEMDTVYHRINACLTTPGEEALYARLRSLPGGEAGWEDALAALDNNPALRQKIQALLVQLGKDSENGLPELMRTPDDYRLPFPWLIRIAALLPLAALSMFFLPLPPGAGFVALVPALLASFSVHYWGEKRLQGRLHTLRYAKALFWCAKRLGRLDMPGLAVWQTALREAYLPFARLRRALSGAVQDGMAMGDIGSLMTFVQFFFLSDLRAYNKVTSLLRKHAKELRALYDAVGMMDVLICTLSFRKSLPLFCLPAFHPQAALHVSDAAHPLLEKGIGNSADFTKGVLITGSNASGKSTFLKALAVNAILAQAIHTCSAASFSLPRARVISSMALRDNLAGGESYFVVEVKSFRRILQAVRQVPCLCFVDEILRGTNTVERIAASAAVLNSLQQGNSLCVAATHDIELASILGGSYDNYHFQEELKDKAVSFDYKLRPGPSRTRNALRLLQAYDFPAEVVSEALAMVDTFEQEHRWPAPDARKGGDLPAPAEAG